MYKHLFLIFFITIIYNNKTNAQSCASATYPDNVVNVTCYLPPESLIYSFKTSNRSTATYSSLATNLVGDIDGDGKMEILAYNANYSFNTIYFLDASKTGLPVKYTHKIINGSINFTSNAVSFADVDKDGKAELFYTSFDGCLYCVNFNEAGTNYKTTAEYKVPYNHLYPYNLSLFQYYLSSQPMLADFNNDGIPEVMVFDRIYNAQTGTLLVDGNFGTDGNYGVGAQHNQGSLMAIADLDGDCKLEIAAGNKSYKVNITNPNGTAGNSITLWHTVNKAAHPEVGDGATAVADIDLDGKLDVIVSRRYKSTNANPGTQSNDSGVIFVWNPRTGNLITNSITDIPINIISNEMWGGPSVPLIADMTGNGYPEIAVSAYLTTRAYKFTAPSTLSLLWSKATNDKSASTGLTLFDFNIDGSSELVYRDETHLRILKGSDGSDLTIFPCSSATGNEYPVVADINNDGAAEIVVTGRSSGYDIYGNVYVFSSNANNWAPARKVWNQYAYNVVNINEDLTVPQYQYNPATVMGGVNRPFNAFLQQATIINQNGEIFRVTPDAVLKKVDADFDCDSTINVSMEIANEGSNVLAVPFYISVYQASTHKIYEYKVTETLNVGNSKTITFTIAKNDLNLAYLPTSTYVFSVNDKGTGIAQNGGQQSECNLTNNQISKSLTSKTKSAKPIVSFTVY